jgi:hypothetical protein
VLTAHLLCCELVVQIMLYGIEAAGNGTATASQFDYIQQGVAYRYVQQGSREAARG